MSVRNPQTPEDWARRKAIADRAYARRRQRFYAVHRRGHLCGVKHGGKPCGTRLREVVDRIGRVSVVCDRCERKRSGVCARCPLPVYGTKGKALYCAVCVRKVGLERDKQWARRYPERKAASVRAWRTRNAVA